MINLTGEPFKKTYIGIDIGSNGGVCILDDTGKVIELFKTPATRMEFYNKLISYKNIHCMCILEKVHSQPQNGGKANFTFGATAERVLYTLEVCGIAYSEVNPQQWMKTYMMKKEKGETNPQWKGRLKEKARTLFPNENITLWSADALLIAEFCRRHYK